MVSFRKAEIGSSTWYDKRGDAQIQITFLKLGPDPVEWARSLKGGTLQIFHRIFAAHP